MTTPSTTITDKLRKKLDAYQPPAQAIHDLLEITPTVLLVGITAAGKDTIKQELLRQHGGTYHRIVSHTTRAPRPNHGVMEVNDVDYHFVDVAAVERLLDEKAFIEAKLFSGNVYGTSLAELQAAHDEGKIALAPPEVQGAAEYMKFSSKARPIFILPPDYDTWQQRFMKRYGHDATAYAADIQRRLRANQEELAFGLSKNYFYFVINNKLEDAVSEVHRIATGHDQPPHEKTRAHRVARSILKRLNAAIEAESAR